MRLAVRALPLAALLAAAAPTAESQAPPVEPAPAVTPVPDESALPTPVPRKAARIRETPAVVIEKLPSDNPFGSQVDVPAALPPKLLFADATVPAAFFVSIRVDPGGRVVMARRERDPIPSLASESLRSFQRWAFSPGRRGGQPVDTWGVYRIELSVEIDAPKVTLSSLTPVAPSTPLPRPYDWPAENEWLESRHAPAPSDGPVPIELVDSPPLPQKTPWSADSHKGLFAAKYWVKVGRTGKIERAIPLEVNEPVLLPYLRQAMNAWVLRPAQRGGAAVDSWNELALAGQVSWSDEIRQIQPLRRSIGP